MKRLLQFSACLFALTLSLGSALGQSFDLSLTKVANQGVNGGHFDVRVDINSVGPEFALGASNLVFDYNSTALSNPTLLTAHNFDGGFYGPITVTEPALGRTSVNIELYGPNSGTTVTNAPMPVATIRFTITDDSQFSSMTWRTVSPNGVVVFVEDQATIASANNLGGLDILVPVELTSFEARADGNQVILNWATASETENLGFHVYRSQKALGEYERLTSTAIPGAGNSAEQHVYSYVDESVAPGETYYYKLADVDFNGVITFHGPVSVAVENVPAEYELLQNFPNPFNPRTVIRYQLPEASEVKLLIYNTQGQVVRTLVSGQIPAGNHSIMWNGTADDGARVASGVYIYRLETPAFVFQKKLVLTK